MFKNFKKGFGLISGIILGKATLTVIAESILRRLAKDEDYMERIRKEKPYLYERVKKYQPKKAEDSKKEEAQ